MSTWGYTLVSVGAVSLLSLIGAFTLAMDRRTLHRLLLPLVGLAVGALFGGAVLHLIPHALHDSESDLDAMLLVCAGFLGFFLLDRAIERVQRSHGRMKGVKSYVPMNLVGDGAHNLLDGMVIAAGYMAGTSVGIAATLAVVAHEVPHEMGDFGVLVHGGLSVRRALLFNFLSALLAVIGAVGILILGTRAEHAASAVIPAAAGAFLYLAGARLMPELQGDERPRGRTVLQAGMIALGMGVMWAAMLLENGTHAH